MRRSTPSKSQGSSRSLGLLLAFASIVGGIVDFILFFNPQIAPPPSAIFVGSILLLPIASIVGGVRAMWLLGREEGYLFALGLLGVLLGFGSLLIIGAAV